MALIDGYEEYKWMETHPTLKKNYWENIIEISYTKVET